MAEVLNKTGGAEDDEEWLYGGSENAENKQPGAEAAPVAVVGSDALPGTEDVSLDKSQEKFAEDDDDSDDEDDVQVTIGDIKAYTVDAGNRMFKGGAPYPKGAQAAGQKIGTLGPGVKGVDPDAEGIVNGVSVFEFNLDTLKDDEKPWRKPGADITDYFNYGFNEDSWKIYCNKQNKLRAENGLSAPKFTGTGNHPTFIRVSSTLPSVHHPAGPSVRVLTSQHQQLQPVTHAGHIAVIGSTAASRRPAVEEIQTIGTIGADMDVKPDIGMPPPPGMVMEMPPPDYSVPPPGMTAVPHVFPNIPPPGMSVPPPIFNPPPPQAFYPPPHIVPPPEARFQERPPFPTYEVQGQNPGYPTDPNEGWDSRDPYRDKYDYKKRDKSPSSGYSRDYSRSRDSRRDRSRSRSRSRSRERRHRDRDDKHKSKSRKIKTEPDDSDYYKSSKHKKSKRSKRDKSDDDYSPSRPSKDDEPIPTTN